MTRAAHAPSQKTRLRIPEKIWTPNRLKDASVSEQIASRRNSARNILRRTARNFLKPEPRGAGSGTGGAGEAAISGGGSDEGMDHKT
jgi:hypothetical protein